MNITAETAEKIQAYRAATIAQRTAYAAWQGTCRFTETDLRADRYAAWQAACAHTEAVYPVARDAAIAHGGDALEVMMDVTLAHSEACL